MRFSTVAAMPGNPSFYEGTFRDFSPESLRKLRDMNADTVFVNLAWSRPSMDAVVLEHLVVSDQYSLLSGEVDTRRNLERFRARARAVAQAGMKPFGLFGIPHYFAFDRLTPDYRDMMGASESTIEGGKSLLCINAETVRKLYAELIGKLRAAVPELRGILIYTYDELAEVCGRESDCPRCKGIPEEERIPAFLNDLYARVNGDGGDFAFWWEPWELACGQTYRILEKLDRRIAVCCHTTINEVYFINETDTWFRNIAAIAQRQGREMIGEVFASGSGEDIGPIAGYACPRLVYNQVMALRRLPGVTGIKEYYGVATPFASVNEAVFMRAVEENGELDAFIRPLARRYARRPDELLEAWECGAQALEMTPWAVSWVLRFGNYLPYDCAYWGKNRFVDLMKTPWSTPSWLSARRSYYMVVECECNFTSTVVGDLDTCFSLAAERLDDAMSALSRAEVLPEFEGEAALWRQAYELYRVQLICRKNHLLLSECAKDIRTGEAARTRAADALLAAEETNAARLLAILDDARAPYRLDRAAVERTIGLIRASRSALKSDPDDWAKRYYLPLETQEKTNILLSL